MKKIIAILFLIPATSFADYSENWEKTRDMSNMIALPTNSMLNGLNEYKYRNNIPSDYDVVEFSLNTYAPVVFAPFGTLLKNPAYVDSYSEPFFALGIYDHTFYAFGYISNSNYMKTEEWGGETHYETTNIPDASMLYDFKDGDVLSVKIQRFESDSSFALIVNGVVENTFKIYTTADFNFYFGGHTVSEWVAEETTPDDLVGFYAYNSAVPEPSSCAVIIGMATICYTIYRRRRLAN